MNCNSLKKVLYEKCDRKIYNDEIAKVNENELQNCIKIIQQINFLCDEHNIRKSKYYKYEKYDDK